MTTNSRKPFNQAFVQLQAFTDALKIKYKGDVTTEHEDYTYNDRYSKETKVNYKYHFKCNGKVIADWVFCIAGKDKKIYVSLDDYFKRVKARATEDVPEYDMAHLVDMV